MILARAPFALLTLGQPAALLDEGFRWADLPSTEAPMVVAPPPEWADFLVATLPSLSQAEAQAARGEPWWEPLLTPGAADQGAADLGALPAWLLPSPVAPNGPADPADLQTPPQLALPPAEPTRLPPPAQGAPPPPELITPIQAAIWPTLPRPVAPIQAPPPAHGAPPPPALIAPIETTLWLTLARPTLPPTDPAMLFRDASLALGVFPTVVADAVALLRDLRAASPPLEWTGLILPPPPLA